MAGPFNMLPPHGDSRGRKVRKRSTPSGSATSHYCKRFLFALIVLLWITTACAPNPNIQIGITDLPTVQTWDGVPSNDFRQEWFQTLQHALGSIAQDGWTLLQTASDLDLGARMTF